MPEERGVRHGCLGRDKTEKETHKREYASFLENKKKHLENSN